MTIAVNSIFTAAQGVRVKAPAQGWHAVAGGVRQIPPAREVLFDPYHCCSFRFHEGRPPQPSDSRVGE